MQEIVPPGTITTEYANKPELSPQKKKVLQVYDLFLSRNSDGLLFTLKAAC